MRCDTITSSAIVQSNVTGDFLRLLDTIATISGEFWSMSSRTEKLGMPEEKALQLYSEVTYVNGAIDEGLWEALMNAARTDSRITFGGHPGHDRASEKPCIVLPNHKRHPECVFLLSVDCDFNTEDYSIYVHTFGRRNAPDEEGNERLQLFHAFRFDGPEKAHVSQDNDNEHECYHIQLIPEDCQTLAGAPKNVPFFPVAVDNPTALLSYAVLSSCGKKLLETMILQADIHGESVRFLEQVWQL